jgi:hypothetical protein
MRYIILFARICHLPDNVSDFWGIHVDFNRFHSMLKEAAVGYPLE